SVFLVLFRDLIQIARPHAPLELLLLLLSPGLVFLERLGLAIDALGFGLGRLDVALHGLDLVPLVLVRRLHQRLVGDADELGDHVEELLDVVKVHDAPFGSQLDHDVLEVLVRVAHLGDAAFLVPAHGGSGLVGYDLGLWGWAARAQAGVSKGW
ncbi:hypothetical protein F4808DRAFT_476015, partial [Astrocystis sublimbata]